MTLQHQQVVRALLHLLQHISYVVDTYHASLITIPAPLPITLEGKRKDDTVLRTVLISG